MVQLTDKGHWAIEVPSMAFGLMINNYGDESELMYMLSMEDIADEPNHEESLITKKLPKGTWQFLFTTKGCTEEDARKVVEIDGNGYKDYGGTFLDIYPFTNPIESFDTLLRSKGCDVNKNWAIILKQNDNGKE